MSTLGIVLLGSGLAIVAGFLTWSIFAGVRQKRQVDRDYAQLQARDRALENSVRATLASR